MDEANHTLPQAPATSQGQRQAMGRAVIVLARQRAIKEVKREYQAQGLRPHHFPYRVIVAAAYEYLAGHRAELIAEARKVVDQWHVEGVFGPRGGIRVR